MNEKNQQRTTSSEDLTRYQELHRLLATGEEQLAEPTQPCYVHEIEDANATPYDPEKHGLCMLCAAKLWEIARVGTEFDRGDTTVVMMLVPRPETRGPIESDAEEA